MTFIRARMGRMHAYTRTRTRARARIGAGRKTESERGAVSLPPDICDSRAVERLKTGQGVSEYL